MSEHRAHTTTLNDGVVAIDTEYARPLQDASHLIVENGRAAFVDTGANNAVPLLIDALAQNDLDRADVDYVFLTHIHLDHAGGAGLLMQQLPNARCVIHPRGANHMIDPTRLMAGTISVYGEDAARELYGELEPIDASRIDQPQEGDTFSLGGRELRTFYTEGHALHHYSIYDGVASGVFSGDSFGVSYRELDTPNGAFIFPSSTPTHFDPDAAHAAYDRILSFDPQYVYLTHYSRVDELDRLANDLHHDIDAYATMALNNRDADDRQAALQDAMYRYLSSRLRAHGYAGSDDAMRSILEIDTVLNAQGLVSWLQRLEKKG
ncbi:MAG: MBL fold metallo-hydrolase [Pseudomonadota bacterium]